MEDEKKKKRNKKKKNKQIKPAVENEEPKINEDFDNRLSRGVGDSANVDHNHAPVQEYQNQVSETTQFENEVAKINVEKDLSNRLSNGGEGMVFRETVETPPRENDPPTKQQIVMGESSLGLQNEHEHISKEASLGETNIGLPHDNGVENQKEDSLDEKIKQEGNEIHLQRETSLESKLLQLEKERDSWLLTQDGLNEKIKELQEENELRSHKEASLEWKLLQLEKEIDDGLHKQADLEEKFNHLVERTESLSSKESRLEEKVKQLEMERDSWLKKENSIKETAANLDGNFNKLQKQVMDLEESRKYLLNEKQRLGVTISSLQFQIQTLEERVASTVSSIEMRKVNDPNIKPDPQDLVNYHFQGAVSASTVEISQQFGNLDITSKLSDTTSAYTDRIDISKDILIQDEKNNSFPKSSENDSQQVKTIESFEDVAIQSEGEDHKNIHTNGNIVISDPSYPNDTGKIAQISLHEEKTDIPISDSPLIGAPFRVVSFFARYVSGADLVNKS